MLQYMMYNIFIYSNTLIVHTVCESHTYKLRNVTAKLLSGKLVVWTV